MRVEARSLDKNYNGTQAVSDLSFSVEPGTVTGFLGPNGSGKSTTMRLMLGLDHGDGETLWDDKPLVAHPNPTRVVGAHLDGRSFHPKRTARNHLRVLAGAAGVSDARVDEVLEQMGLESVAGRTPDGFSLGMGQRLGLAGAVLASPSVLMLDEPANGLDPQSITWLRDFLRHYAEEGRSVLVSSHLLSEMQLMADTLVVIARGSLVASETLQEFVGRSTLNDVLVRARDADKLAQALADAGIDSERQGADGLSVKGASCEQVGDLAFATGVAVIELQARVASLEAAFLEATSDKQQYELGSQGPTATGGDAS